MIANKKKSTHQKENKSPENNVEDFSSKPKIWPIKWILIIILIYIIIYNLTFLFRK